MRDRFRVRGMGTEGGGGAGVYLVNMDRNWFLPSLRNLTNPSLTPFGNEKKKSKCYGLTIRL